MSTRTFRFPVVAPQATRLANTCVGMAEGAYAIYSPTGAKLPDVTTANAMAWSQHWYIKEGGYGHFLAKAASGARLRYCRFDPTTDAWTQLYFGQPPSNVDSNSDGVADCTGFGHIWDCHAFDAATERLWWLNDPSTKPTKITRWDATVPTSTMTWGSAGSGYSGQFNTTPAGMGEWVVQCQPNEPGLVSGGLREAAGIEWFPELNGGRFVWASGGYLGTADLSGSQTTLLSSGTGTAGQVFLHRPSTAEMFVWQDTVGWKITAAGGVTSLPTAPINVDVNTNADFCGAVILGKNSSVLLIERGYVTARVWRLNEQTNAWDLVGTHPFALRLREDFGLTNYDNGSVIPVNEPFSSTNYVAVNFANAYGCVAAIAYNASGFNPRMMLWKPSV